MLVFVPPNSSYVRPKLKVIGQMSCQVKYLFAALQTHTDMSTYVDIPSYPPPLFYPNLSTGSQWT